MGIKNLFTKEKKEVSEATLELQKELRKIKRKKIVEDIKNVGTIMLAAYGLGSIVGEIIVGVSMARRSKDQKFANSFCNRLLNGKTDEYESMIMAVGPKKEDGEMDLIFSASTDKEVGKILFDQLSNNLKEIEG